MKFNRKNVINSSSDTSEDEMQLIKNQKKGDDKMNKKIDKMVEFYRTKEMNEVEKKILKGIVQDNMSDGNEGLSDEDDIVNTGTVGSGAAINTPHSQRSLTESAKSGKHGRAKTFGKS